MEIRHSLKGVHAISAGIATPGELNLTDDHIIFSAPVKSQPPASPAKTGTPSKSAAAPRRESWICYPMVHKCEFRPTPANSGLQPSLRIQCHDFTFVTFNFADNKVAQDAFNFVKQRTCRTAMEKLYAFQYKPSKAEREINGWEIYSVRDEFRRQGISEKSTPKGWRISSMNKDHVFSPTYPATLAVPTKVSDSTLKYAASHRTRNRIPTLSYLHPVNNCSITRSSQPRVGLRNNRSIQDETLVVACFSASHIRDASPGPSQGNTPQPSQSTEELAVPHNDSQGSSTDISDLAKLEDDLLASKDAFFDEKGNRLVFGAQQQNLIVDARPLINSLANHLAGKGSENMDYYKAAFAKKAFLNIDNIHVMRKSLAMVVDAIKDADVSTFGPDHKKLAKSGWLKHIAGILSGSSLIARQVAIQHSNVLIHCSDGWDRTSQLSALSQLMLDPYYRTLDGYITLVEKDWLSFGHMFQLRSGYLGLEKNFTINNDAMAGSKVEPNEPETRNDVVENAMAGARRFFRQTLNQDIEREESDSEKLAAAEESDANSPLEHATKENELSPVFQQFLDATYQMLRQFPNRFEFNERFLRRIHYHQHACQYGTFFFNNEEQRKTTNLAHRTGSVWDYFLSRRKDFVNPHYDAEVDDAQRDKERLLLPDLEKVRWWHDLFNRTEEEMNGPLNAAAAAAQKVATFANSEREAIASGRSSTSSRNGDDMAGIDELPTNPSVLVGVESSGTDFKAAVDPSGESAAAPRSSVSDRLAAMRDGIAGMNLGLPGVTSPSKAVSPERSSGEMQEMR